jgi:hypothetical protein
MKLPSLVTHPGPLSGDALIEFANRVQQEAETLVPASDVATDASLLCSAACAIADLMEFGQTHVGAIHRVVARLLEPIGDHAEAEL